ncbi:MAG: PAS domain S-box protein [Deltaproteobacteria bacterium]|nr:PAS domain S-box protein [Deltaproteobacteria bacterium]
MKPDKTPRPLRILLVEDDEHDRLAFRRALGKSDVECEIEECVKAEEALERLRQDASAFDGGVVDYALPGISGFELCKELIAKRTPLPLIILTGRGSEQLAVKALKAGVADYIIKDPGLSYLELMPVVLREVARKYGDHEARRRAEEELAESKEKYRTVLEACADPVVVYDMEGRGVYVNPEFTYLFGWTPEEVLGKKLEYVPDDNWPETQVMIDKVLAGKSFSGIESRRYTKEGNILDVSISAAIHLNRDGTPAGSVHILRDITAQKLAEEHLQKAHDELEFRVEERTAKLARTAEQLKLELSERRRIEESLRLSEQRFRSVVQTAGDAIMTIDSTGKIVFWNDAAEDIFGYSAEEVTGKVLTFIMPERFREDHRKGLEQAVSTGKSGIIGKTVDRVGRRKNGEEFPVELSLASWKTQEGVFFTGFVRDVTRRKRAEQEIRHLSRQLISVIEEERKRLARDLHDEFGQALTTLHFGIEALRNSLPAELENLKTSCDEFIRLIQELGEDIRNIASELRPGMLDHLGLVPTLEWYIADFATRMGGLHIDFQAIGIKDRPDSEIEIVLYRILQEALNNIAKHSKAEHVDVLLTYSHPKLIFTIKDDGVGFEQAEEGMLPSGSQQGGIGLLGMRERVGSVGGKVDIRSKSEEGTMIRVELPISIRKAGG